MRLWPLLVTTLAFAGCEGSPPPFGDSRPPLLLSAEVSEDGNDLNLAFDEPVAEAEAGGDFLPPEVTPAPRTIQGSTVTVPLPDTLKPGRAYGWTAEVRDPAQNLTSVAGRFYGPNDHPATLRLNELRIAGSAAHPDFVELRVLAPGSLGGWTLEVWPGPQAPTRLVLDDVAVEEGALVVVYPKAEGPTDPASGALVYRWPASKGLPGTTGVVLLRPKPGAEAADAVVYAKEPGKSQPIARAAGVAQIAERPSTGCTPTRTWCRTDEGDRWIVTATGGASPGGPNRLTEWAGPPSSQKAPPTTTGE